MRINLIHPPQINVIDDRLDPPLGLLSIASNLIRNGYTDTKITDLSGVPEKCWEIEEADIYGITVYSPSLFLVKKIARICKSKNSKAVVVCGGIHATILPETLLDSSDIDCVVKGYGEYAMVEIATDYPHVSQIYTGIVEDINDLPYPNRDLVDIPSYSRVVDGLPSFNMQTARGCPFRCSFCSEHVLTRKILFRDSKSILSEITYIREKYNGSALFIYDDIFTLDKNRLHEITRMFKENEIVFDFHLRADSVTPLECSELHTSGGRIARIGIESYSDKMLSLMNKKTTRKHNIDAIKHIRDSGLTSRIFIIFGFPGEDEHTVEETISGIEEADPDQIFLSTFVPFPGSHVWDNPEKYGITSLDRDYTKYSFVSEKGKGHIVFDTAHENRDRMLLLQDKMYRYVYSRPFRGKTQKYHDKLLKNMVKT